MYFFTKKFSKIFEKDNASNSIQAFKTISNIFFVDYYRNFVSCNYCYVDFRSNGLLLYIL